MYLERKKKNGKPYGSWIAQLFVANERVKFNTGSKDREEAEKRAIAEKVRLQKLHEDLKTLDSARDVVRDLEVAEGVTQLPISYEHVEAAVAEKKSAIVDYGDDVEAGKFFTAQVERFMIAWRDFEAFMLVQYPGIKFVHELTDLHAEKYFLHLKGFGLFQNTANHQRGKDQISYEKKPLSDYQRNKRISNLRHVFKNISTTAGVTVNIFRCEHISGISEKETKRKVKDRQQLKDTGMKSMSFTAAECELLFRNPDIYCWPIFMIGYYTGLRLADILTLEWADVDFKKREIHRIMSKTLKPCFPPLFPELYNWLKEQHKVTGHTKYVLDKKLYVDEYNEVVIKKNRKGKTKVTYPGRQRISNKWAAWIDSFAQHKCDAQGRKLYTWRQKGHDEIRHREIPQDTFRVGGKILKLEPIMEPVIKRVYKEEGKRAACVRGPHALRHHYCYRLMMGHGVPGGQPIPLPILKDYVGHTMEKMTSHYCQDADPEDKARFRKLIAAG
jgi:integrase